MRGVALLTTWLLAACGSGTAPPEPPATGAAPAGPGAECLEAAAAAREPTAGAPESIGVAHVLVRHAELERNADDRSREEACLRALEALDKLQAGEEFDAVVAEYSDEKGAVGRGGSLGSIRRDDVHREFADAAWALEPDELSYVVETKSGFHIILRTE